MSIEDQLKAALSFGRSLGLGRGPRQTDGAFGNSRRTSVQRLKPATGPGSINETSELKALIESGEREAAAQYYERCRQINYRAGRPKMRWGDVWYFSYKAAVARGELT